jgi:predicted DsbA family dithiol-disulfide isomerase
MTKTPLTIDFVADLVCPWCYVGWRHLQLALEQRPDVTPAVTWRPFQLDPSTPAEGRDRAAHLAAKFPDKARLDEVHDRLAEMAKAAGLDMKLREVAKIPNTMDAHRLLMWARARGDAALMTTLLFRAYWTDLRDIGDVEVLADVAAQTGLNREGMLAWLKSGEGADLVTREYEMAARMGVTGVPFFVFGGRVAASGAQPPEGLVQAIDKALELAAA